MLQKEIIVENTSKDFAEFLYEGIGTDELQIYIGLLLKFSTYIELMEIRNKIDDMEFSIKIQEIGKSLEEFEKLPGGLEIFNPRECIFQIITKLPV